MSESAGVAITTVLSVLAIIDIVGNTLVCVVIKRNREMRIPMNYLLVNLAVADILYATFIALKIFFKLTFTHQDGAIGTVLCKFITGGPIAWVGGASSIVTLVAIAIERYYAVMYPHGNKRKLTKAKLKVIIPGIWIFSLALNSLLFLYTKFEKKSNACVQTWPDWVGKAFTLMWWLFFVFLSCALMVVLYSKVVYTLWFKRNDDNQLTHQQKGVIRVRKRVTLMVVAVSAIFVICWGTGLVVYMLKYVTPHNIGPVPIVISNTVILFNSAVNPLVYALLNQQFREKIKRMICCTGSLPTRVHFTPEQHNIDPVNKNTQPTNTAGPTPME